VKHKQHEEANQGYGKDNPSDPAGGDEHPSQSRMCSQEFLSLGREARLGKPENKAGHTRDQNEGNLDAPVRSRSIHLSSFLLTFSGMEPQPEIQTNGVEKCFPQ
jgi:hypothetical protein